MTLIHEIRSVSDDEILISVDHEGGRVQRFRNGFSTIPAAGLLGDIFDADNSRALDLSEKSGWLMAVDLLSIGVDISYAPVLDLRNMKSSVIGSRGFHEKPEVIVELASAFVKGMRNAGMPCVLKHYPGHGSIVEDSHFCIPVDPRDFQDIWHSDLIPFRKLIFDGAEAVMASHVFYPQVDPRTPVYSKYWLKDVLRGKLGFKGVVFSDDMNMKGADCKLSLLEKIKFSFEAGVDIVLAVNSHKEELADTLQELKDTGYDKAVENFLSLRKNKADSLTEIMKSLKYSQIVREVSEISVNIL